MLTSSINTESYQTYIFPVSECHHIMKKRNQQNLLSFNVAMHRTCWVLKINNGGLRVETLVLTNVITLINPFPCEWPGCNSMVILGVLIHILMKSTGALILKINRSSRYLRSSHCDVKLGKHEATLSNIS